MYPLLYEYTIAGYHRPVAGYGLMVALGMVTGLAVALRTGHRRGLDGVHIALVTLLAIIAGIIGCYLLFVVTILPQAWRDPTVLWQGGLVFYGGPLLAVPVAYMACRRLKLPAWQVADIAAPALAVGHGFGRMGCFLGGCCYGAKWDSPWAVVFTHQLAPASYPPLPRHPLQLYEAAFLLVATAVMLWWWPRLRRHGQLALSYVVAYGLWRFVVEYWRADGVRGYLVPDLLSTSQAISLVVAPVALALWFHRRRRAQHAPEKLMGS